jgi:hypothetical protein
VPMPMKQRIGDSKKNKDLQPIRGCARTSREGAEEGATIAGLIAAGRFEEMVSISKSTRFKIVGVESGALGSTTWSSYCSSSGSRMASHSSELRLGLRDNRRSPHRGGLRASLTGQIPACIRRPLYACPRTFPRVILGKIAINHAEAPVQQKSLKSAKCKQALSCFCRAIP